MIRGLRVFLRLTLKKGRKQAATIAFSPKAMRYNQCRKFFLSIFMQKALARFLVIQGRNLFRNEPDKEDNHGCAEQQQAHICKSSLREICKQVVTETRSEKYCTCWYE